MNAPVDTDIEFTGKYEEGGRIGGWLIDRFYDAVRDLLEPQLPASGLLLEVGCGAGFSTERIRPWLPTGVQYLGSDVGATLLVKASCRNPGLSFVRQSVYRLPFEDASVDAVVMLEVLEHLDDPSAALAELRRVCRGPVLLSTPREPIWCALNMARGKYWGDWGNTPGHVNHWSTRGLIRRVSPWFDVVAYRQPLPWSVLLLQPRP